VSRQTHSGARAGSCWRFSSTTVDARAGRSHSSAPIANFTDVAAKAGLTASNVYGGMDTKKYILEITGNGVAVFYFDNDGWPDLIVANGHVYPEMDKFHLGIDCQEPRVFYNNNGNGTFEDISAQARAGITKSLSLLEGWWWGTFGTTGNVRYWSPT